MSQVDLRSDLKVVADFIEEKSRVFDIGSSDGKLLECLANGKKCLARGMDVSQSDVSECVKKGLSVVQGDADQDLIYYPDKSFDYAVSTEVIQATKNPKEVLSQMLRISNKVVISLPNFGYWRNRLYLLFKGRMPVTKTLRYEWYETPNIHFSTVKDFLALCKELNCVIEKQAFLSPNGNKILANKSLANLLCEKAVFVLKPEFDNERRT